MNIRQFPLLGAAPEEVEAAIQEELGRFRLVWTELERKYGCVIIQNNFDLPALRPLGNLEAGAPFGRVAFVNRLNAEFARLAALNPKLVIHDIHSLSADVGLARWFDEDAWFSYKMAVSPHATVLLAKSLAALVNAVYGRTKKCLVLDLDNTLWGGVVGDDGVANLKLGSETALGESYTEFQRYVKQLKDRGILLAVCSKNEEASALDGLRHPDGLLRPEDFAVIAANWLPKHENIAEIARRLNIGLDSLVFVDDNPVERDIVRKQLPAVAVPEVGSDVSRFASILEQERYFETVSISQDDIERSAYYARNAQRDQGKAAFADYGEFLRSLDMVAEIRPFAPVYLDRIAQLTNKTNQFNLTTRRYTQSEIEQVSREDRFIHLYGRLTDKFGDNGLISVVVGETAEGSLNILLWLMSCRVLKRGMEQAMMDALVESCQARGLTAILGTYLPTAKNAMVAGLYGELGFSKMSENEAGRTAWRFEIPVSYTPQNRFIGRVK
ncbi:MAG: HAD-IIIC family phosphatase [Bryobacteraceae bacterium]